MPDITPAHQWTHDGGNVLIVKCVRSDGTSHGGFQWPESGPVTPDTWSEEPTCESGGLFGWPWGVGLGGGKQPDYQGRWIVFSAEPSDVVDLDDKCKARCGNVVYCGDWWGALLTVDAGRIAWCEHGDSGASSATGDRGASSATGDRGIAAATGCDSTVEAGPGGIACTTAAECVWRVHEQAVFVQRWLANDGWRTAVLDPRTLGITTGQLVSVVKGRITSIV